ncbi:MAG: biotin--[acetyl-CoA-carboxylase] ligase [Phycisphaerae bacterium]
MMGIHLDAVDSTNEEVKRRIRAGDWHGDGYLCAREQRAGRGRFDRSWQSPRDAGIYVSVVLAGLQVEQVDAELVSRAGAIGCATAVRALCAQSPLLKPINDVYLRVAPDAAPGKLAGVLVESFGDGHGIHTIIVGVGINTKQLDRGLSPPTVVSCLEDVMQVTPELTDALLSRTVDEVAVWCRKALDGDHAGLEKAWDSFERWGDGTPS